MKTILVVDNDELARKHVASVLSSKGFKVDTASSGIEGLNKAVDTNPDLIISELDLPKLNGNELLLVIRKNNQLSKVPLIFLTAKADYDEMRFGLNHGANDLLQKPFSDVDLINSINSVFEKISRIETSIDGIKNSIFIEMNHQLRTPLTPMLGFSTLLEEQYKSSFDDGEIKDIVGYLTKSIKKYHALVNNFTKYTNISLSMNDSNYLKKTTSQVIYSPKLEIMKYALKSIDMADRTDDISFDIDDIPLYFDELFFTYVVEELVLNAVKYSETGNKILVSGKVINNKYTFSIVCEGAGLTKEQIQNIAAFSTFDRVNGNFLGLITIKRMLMLTGHQLKIESQPGEMTTYSINFDLSEDEYTSSTMNTSVYN